MRVCARSERGVRLARERAGLPLLTELRSEGLPPDILGPLDRDGVVIAKTASRSVLGFMSDIALQVRYRITAAGGLGRSDISTLNQRLRRTLHNYGGTYAYPIDRVLERQQPVTRI